MVSYAPRVEPTRTLNQGAKRGDTVGDGAASSGPPLCVRIERPGVDAAEVRLDIDERLTVGRLGTADVVVDAPTVSRLHAVITRAGAGAVVQDCESHNGTVVARGGVQHRLEAGAKMLLTVGDVVEIGGPDAARLTLSEAAARRDSPMTSPPAARLEQALSQAARTALPVVLYGPSGSGKTHAARRLHEMTGNHGPFVAINCARLPADPLALQSELLGHRKGSFTGAHADRVGRLEHADGGTVFFDEVDSMPALAQGFLLDILENSGDATPLGGGPRDALRVKFRVISASKQALAASGLRHDLSERLAEGHLLVVPSLDDRRDDIPSLVREFADEQAALLGRPVEVGDACVQAMVIAKWPGQIRQLRAAVTTMAQIAAGARPGAVALEVADFAAWQQTRVAVFEGSGAPGMPAPTTANSASAAPPTDAAILGEQARLLKREDIMAALEATNGNQAAAARRLGIARNTLLKRVKQFDIPPDHGALPRGR